MPSQSPPPPRDSHRGSDPTLREKLIVVDARNRAVGASDKRTVHEAALLHRAFSICLFDREGRMLLQQRSLSKYHSPGLWANTCCGHPRPGERTLRAAHRRLHEELGAAANLRFGFITRYEATFPDGLTENEIVYVYFGLAPDGVRLNPREVSAVAQMSLAELKRDVRKNPDAYAAWLQHYVIHHFTLIADGARFVQRRARQR